MHLQPEELVDLADGTRAESSAPHLAACADCRRQLGEMRAMMSAVVDIDVPEPSPLFWDHLSARVSAAVAAEGAPRSAWSDIAAWRRVLMPACAVALAFIVVFVSFSSRVKAPQPPAAAVNGSAFNAAPPADAGAEVLEDASSGDASLMLVANLTEAMDLDAASDAGLAPSGSAEHAVTHMGGDDLRELERLLKEEMVGS